MINERTQFTRAMLGYALWIATEDTLRNWIAKRLVDLFGSEWDQQIPAGIWNRLLERYDESVKTSNLSQVRDLLEHSDFPDLFDIVKYKKKSKLFLPESETEEIDYYNAKLYTLRNLIAHKPYSFNIRNLDDLSECAEWVIKIAGSTSSRLVEVKNGIEDEPEKYAQPIPEEFIVDTRKQSQYKITNNFPPMDYEYDGGFVGRRKERQDLKRRLLDKRIHPVITVSGAGGVGKTALAHYVCEDVLTNHPEAFDGLVWISAKRDRLTVTGIEEIEPTAQTFEEVLDAILSTFGFSEYIDHALEDKKQTIQDIVIDDTKYGILLVIDNLETIVHDQSLIEYLKDIPLPHKVLITSRIGLGEIERRINIEEMSPGDAVELFRVIAREKSVKGLAQLPSETIKAYVKRMSSYPLVIKWVIGQAAVSKDFDRLVQNINSTDSDISKFCFEYIFDRMLSQESKLVLQCLATSDQELTQPVLMHVAELTVLEFEDVMLELELASLIIPSQDHDSANARIVTRYGILPLTRAYILSKEGSKRDIKARLQGVLNLAENARRAKRHYELSLEYFGAETDWSTPSFLE